MENIKFITKKQFSYIIRGDIKNLLRTDNEDDPIFNEEYEAIYEVFCGYKASNKESENQRPGIDFDRLKQFNREFSAKMNDAGFFNSKN